MKSVYLFILLGLFQVHAATTQAQSLETIGQLARDGAPNLALQLMDQVQPDAKANTPGWIFFERQRFAIMQNWQQWQALVQRHDDLPTELPETFLQWAKLQQIDALVKLNQTGAARKALRALLWQSQDKSKLDIPLIRRLIIRSYLIDENFDDVDLAMRHYEIAYGNKDWEWQKLRARVLLQKKQPKQALPFLSFVDGDINDLKKRDILDHEALAMRLLAQLSSGQRTPKSVLGDVRILVDDKKLASAFKLRYLAVGIKAAQEFGGMLTRVRLAEQALTEGAANFLNDRLFTLNGDDLWQAYDDYANAEGNRQQLLIGQDQKWLSEATKWSKKRPEKARAFYTVVMHRGIDESMRQQAYQQFITLLNQKESGGDLIRHLFASPKYYPQADAIPLFVRYQLVDEAISRQDIERASELMLAIEEAPEAAEKFNWSLRRARVLILGGRVNEGREALNALFNDPAMDVLKTGKNAANPDKPYTAVDAYLQVIFDLQKVDDHSGAVGLLMRLLQAPMPGEAGKKLRREILFWTADSHKSDQNKARNPVLAAAFYLRSATLLDGFGGDPWGQTARFQAADVLAKEGVVEDARRIYKALLKITQEPARRAMIQYRLQELWLSKKN